MNRPSHPSNEEVLAALGTLTDALLDARPDLRPSVAVLAGWLADGAGALRPAAAPAAKPAAESPQVVVMPAPLSNPSPTPASPPTPTHTGYVPLRIGDSVIQVRVEGTTQEIGRARLAAFDGEEPDLPQAPPPDLGLIARRCQIKRRACMAVIHRLETARDPLADYEARERIMSLIGEAKQLPNCFLWMTMPDKPVPPLTALALLARCYANAGEAAALLEAVTTAGAARPRATVEETLALAAEAQSALRAALNVSWLTTADKDQDEIFRWLRSYTETERYFVDRHLRADDPADPTLGDDLHARLVALRGRLESAEKSEREARSQFKLAAYHAGKIADVRPLPAPADWNKVAGAAARLSAMGVSPADRRWDAALGRILDDAPIDIPAPLAAVFDALRRQRSDEEPDDPAAPPRQYSQTVAGVRDVLRGRRIVVVGGEDRPAQRGNLVAAFELAEVDWVALREHASPEPIYSAIGQAGTALVLVLVKLSGHQHVEEAARHSRALGIPCVLLKAGVNPERVAADIIEQASGKLGLDE